MPVTPEQIKKFKVKLKSGEIDPNSEEAKAFIRTRYDEDLFGFANWLLKGHISDQVTKEVIPTPEFHREIHELFKSHQFVAVAAPRGHAKSTVTSFFYALHEALYERKRNIVIVSATADMSQKFLRRLRDEIAFNPLIHTFFGDQRSDKWSEQQLRLSNGCVISAKGQGAQLRGLIEGAIRPDLIVLDDIEDDELVRSELRRADLEDWFNGAVLPTLEPKTGQVIFIGTVLHQDSLLNRLLNNKIYPDFVSKRYAACNEDYSEILWPERFDGEMLRKKKEAYIARGQLSKFYMEYLNNPVPAEAATFRQEYFQFFDEAPPRAECIVECFVDLGGGSIRKEADDTAMVVTYMDKHNTLYVNDYICDKMGTDTKKIAEALFSLYAKYHPSRFVIEKTVAANMLKAGLESEMLNRGVHLNVEYVQPPRGSGDRRGNMSDAKFQRIAAMEAPFKLGAIKIRKWMDRLQEQLLVFPRGQHDDLIDALAYGYMFSKRRIDEDTLDDREDEPTYEPLYAELGL